MNTFSPESLQSLAPIEFENLVKALFIKMGFNATATKASGDGGIDIIAINEQPIIGGKYVIQCKKYAIGNNVGEPIIRELYGVMHAENANKGILISTSDFSKQAITFAQDKAIELINGNSLMTLFNKYFEESYDISNVELKEEDYKSIGNLKNEPEDFRGVPWGSLLETLKDMIFLERHWLGGSVCYRISDSKKLGSAIIESPLYIFDETGRLYLVNIKFQGKSNYELILNYLFKNHGNPFDSGNFTHDWFGENLNIHLQFTPDQSDGQVSFIYNPIYNEIDKTLQQLDAKGFDKLALGFRGIKWGSRLEDLNDFICKFDLSNNTHKTFEKSTDKKLFAGVIAFPNYYFFKDRFYAVGIDFLERNNFETILDYLKKNYGEPYDMDLSYAKPHYKWRNNEFEIFVYFIDEDNRGYVGFNYLPIKNESDEEWQQKKVPIQQQKNYCFVASVIYGSSSADEVITLKLWRDNYLERYLCGRHFIKLYYKSGPLLASYLRKQKLLRKALRFCLDIFVHVLQRRK